MSGVVRALLVIACLWAAGACSLVKLSEDIKQENCGSDSDCDVLNDRSAEDFDPCFVWQCSTDSRLCEQSALDADKDNATAATTSHKGEMVVCETDSARADCDDSNEDNAPGLTESCDGEDNDCDGLADEGALDPLSDDSIGFSNSLGGQAVSSLDYAIDPATGTVALAYTVDAMPDKPGLNLLPRGLAPEESDNQTRGLQATLEAESPAERTLASSAIAIAPLQQKRFAVALFQTTPPRRVLAGVFDADDRGRGLAAEASLYDRGLACATDEGCAANSDPAAAPLAAPETSAIAIGASRSDVVVASVRSPSNGAQRVVLNLLERVGGNDSDYLSEVSTEATVLGATSDAAAPAVLGLPAFTVDGQRTFAGFLVGRIEGDGMIVFDRLERAGDSLEVAQARVLTIGNASMPRQGLSAALGPAEDDGVQLGVAFQQGEAEDARIVVSVVELTANADGELSASAPLLDQTHVGDSDTRGNERLAAITALDSDQGWGVVYRTPLGLLARLISDNGELRGTSPYTLVEKDGTDRQVLSAPLALPLPQTEGWLGALALVSTEENSTPLAFEIARLPSCGSLEGGAGMSK